MKKGIVIGFLLLLMPLVGATQINVETLAGTTVTISILDTADDYYSHESFYDLPAGDSGNVSANYNGDLSEFDIAVYVKIGGETAYYERFRGFAAGDPIYLQLPKKEGAESSAGENSEDSQNNEETESEGTQQLADTNNTNSTPGVTGYVTASEVGAKSDYTYYIIGAIVLVGLGIASFAIKSRKNGPNPPSNPEAAAQKTLPRLSPASGKEDTRAKIEEAERKIREASADLERIKKREKIEEAEQKIENDKAELEKMKLEFDSQK